MITPNSSDGTQMQIDRLRKAWHALHDAKLGIQEINDGDYCRQFGPIEFNVDTCTELRQWILNCTDVIQDLMEVVKCHQRDDEKDYWQLSTMY